MSSDLNIDLDKFDSTQFKWKAALRRVPAIVILLVAGVCFKQTAAGVLAAGSALSVGFGASRQFLGSRFLAMMMTTVSMSAAAFVGTAAGNVYSATLLLTAVSSYLFASLTFVGEDLGWIAMQAVIAFLIGSSYAGTVDDGLIRSSFILIGGLAQITCISMIWRVEGVGRFGSESCGAEVSTEHGPALNQMGQLFLASSAFSALAFRYGLRMAITLVLAVEFDHLLRLQNGYWLPMTALIVLKPDFYQTYTGGVRRVVGTLAGVAFASVLTLVLRPHDGVLISLAGGLGFITYASQKANAVLFSAALTSFVVFMIAVTGLPETSVTWHRLINTALGCLLALTSYSVGSVILHRSLRTANKTGP
jgi:hypothetical protein